MNNQESKRSAVQPPEQETTISYSRDFKEADIWTSDTTVMTKLDKMCEKSPSHYKCIETTRTLDGLLANKRYKVSNKKLISFRSEIGTKNLSDERREQLAEMTRNLAKSKSVDNNNDDDK